MPHLYCQRRKHFPKNPAASYYRQFLKPQRKCHQKRVKSIVCRPSIWQDIIMEDKELENYIKKEKKKNLPLFECSSSYVKRVLFPNLVPAFEKVCAVLLKRCVLSQKRRYYPFHWFLTQDEAAVYIQALVRGFLIRRKYDLVQMKEERKKILEGIEKQKRCYNALQQDIENIVYPSSSKTEVCLKNTQ